MPTVKPLVEKIEPNRANEQEVEEEKVAPETTGHKPSEDDRCQSTVDTDEDRVSSTNETFSQPPPDSIASDTSPSSKRSGKEDVDYSSYDNGKRVLFHPLYNNSHHHSYLQMTSPGSGTTQRPPMRGICSKTTRMSSLDAIKEAVPFNGVEEDAEWAVVVLHSVVAEGITLDVAVGLSITTSTTLEDLCRPINSTQTSIRCPP